MLHQESSCAIIAVIRKNSSRYVSLLMCYKGKSLAILIKNFLTFTSYLHFFVLWQKLLRPASFLPHCVCVSSFTFVSSSYSTNYGTSASRPAHATSSLKSGLCVADVQVLYSHAIMFWCQVACTILQLLRLRTIVL